MTLQSLRRFSLRVSLIAVAFALPFPPLHATFDDPQPKPSGLSWLLPAGDEILGWKRAGQPQTASGEELFLLIDGGADLYLEYGFEETLMTEFRFASGGSLNLEIYRMKDSASAYGIYSFKSGKPGTPCSPGLELCLEDYYLNAWKGDYLITIIGLDRSSATREAFIPLAQAIARRIADAGEKPAIREFFSPWLSLAPRIVLVKGSLALANVWPDYPRQLPAFCWGGMAMLKDFHLLLLEYEGEKACIHAFMRMAALFKSMPDLVDFSADGSRIVFIDRQGRCTVFHYAGSRIVGVIGAPPSIASIEINKMKDRAKTWVMGVAPSTTSML